MTMWEALPLRMQIWLVVYAGALAAFALAGMWFGPHLVMPMLPAVLVGGTFWGLWAVLTSR